MKEVTGNARLIKDVKITIQFMSEQVEHELKLNNPCLERFIERLQGMGMLLLHQDLSEAKRLVDVYVQELRELDRQIS